MPEIATPHLSLPLPHPDHSLAFDVLRIQSALSLLDQKIAALDALLTSDDITLDSIQELVNAIKTSRSQIGAVQALVQDQLDAHNTAVTQQLNAHNTAVTQQLDAHKTAVTQQIQTLTALVYASL